MDGRMRGPRGRILAALDEVGSAAPQGRDRAFVVFRRLLAATLAAQRWFAPSRLVRRHRSRRLERLEAAIGHQAWRLRNETAPTVEQLRLLLPEDLLGNKVMNPGDELVPGTSGDNDGIAPLGSSDAPDAPESDVEATDDLLTMLDEDGVGADSPAEDEDTAPIEDTVRIEPDEQESQS